MPTDTQRAPTLSQCIEREREARGAVEEARQYGLPADALNRRLNTLTGARAATDEAVRAVEANTLTPMEAKGILVALVFGMPDPRPPLLTDAVTKLQAIRDSTTPAPAAQGESTGGEGDER